MILQQQEIKCNRGSILFTKISPKFATQTGNNGLKTKKAKASNHNF